MKRLIIAIVVVLVGLVLASPAQAYPTMPKGFRDRTQCSRLSTATPSTSTPMGRRSRSG